MAHVGHKVMKCRQCGAVVLQCRCMEPDKTVEYVDSCSRCELVAATPGRV